MQDAAERLVNLALLLASSHEYVTAEQCRSAGLGYPEGQDTAAFLRMFERDKEALRAAGLVIGVSLDSDSGSEGYRLDPEATFARPVDLAPGELSALRAVAASLADDHAFPFRDDLALALGRLGAHGDEGPLATTQLVGDGPGAHVKHVRELAEAVQARKAASFDYISSGGVQRRRHVDPYGLFFREGQWYVTGRDTEADAMRTYAIERLTDLEVNEARPRTPDFERPEGFDVRQQERLPFQYGESSFEVRLRFEPQVAWRAERLARGHGRIDSLGDGSALWTVDAADLTRLASWIVDEGPGLHAVDPPELLQRLSDGLRRVVAAHG